MFSKLLEEDVQRIRNAWQVTWRRCQNVSDTSRMWLEEVFSNISGRSSRLLQEDVTTYQERLASDVTKIVGRIRNILQVTWRRCYTVSGTSCMLLKEVVPTYQECFQRYLKKMYNVSGTPDKWLDEDVRTYQIHLACDLKKLFQHIRNVFKVTSRRCYNVSGTSCKWRHEDCRTYQEHLASYLATMLHRKKKRLASSMSQSS